MKLDHHWVNAAFSPAPGRSASLGVNGGGREHGRWDSALWLDSLNPRLIDSLLEINTDDGTVSSAVSLRI